MIWRKKKKNRLRPSEQHAYLIDKCQMTFKWIITSIRVSLKWRTVEFRLNELHEITNSVRYNKIYLTLYAQMGFESTIKKWVTKLI